MPRSKRKLQDEVKKIYCRKCMEYKTPTNFFKATDNFLDSNDYMSVCKQCIDDIYEKFFIIEQSMDKAILRLCRLLNIRFNERALESAKKQIETHIEKGMKNPSVFGNYKAKILMVTSNKIGDKNTNEDLTFIEPNEEIIEKLESPQVIDQEYYENIWGKSQGLNQIDYEFLDYEYGRWVGPIGNVTHGEEVLIRDICHLQNQIRKERITGNDSKVNNLIEARQKIMKDGALTPLLQNAANSGKNADCFGVWLRDIEQIMPAEWYADQEKYKDIDGIEEDIQDIKRSCKNFLVGSRDFGTLDLESINDIDDNDEDGG